MVEGFGCFWAFGADASGVWDIGVFGCGYGVGVQGSAGLGFGGI